MVALVSPVGSEIEVAAGGGFPNSTMLASGNYVVTWLDGIGPTNETMVGVFSPDGTPIGTPYSMMAATGYHEIASLAGGGFVVVYTTIGQVIAQIFDANGAPVGSALPLGTIDYYSNSTFDVTGLAGGGFAASWRYVNTNSVTTFSTVTYDAAGNQVATLAPAIGPGGTAPEIEQLANGTIVLTWHEYDLVSPFQGGYPDGYEISTQMFSANGTALTQRITVNQSQSGSHNDPQIVALAGGGFVITWVHNGGDDAGIWAQLYDQTGTAVGSNFRVSDLTPGWQAHQDVAALSWGGFLVSWMDSSPNNPENQDFGIRAQVFDASGSRLGETFQVNAQYLATEDNPSVLIVSDTEARIFYQTQGNADPSGILERVITLPTVGTSGNDALNGSGATDRMAGLGGNDNLNGGDGDDRLDGGDGNDSLLGLGGNDEIHGGAGADYIDGGDGDDAIYLDASTDILPGEDIRGGSGTDTLIAARAPGADTVFDISAISISGIEILRTQGNATLRFGVDQLAGVTGVAATLWLATSGSLALTATALNNWMQVFLSDLGNQLDLSGLVISLDGSTTLVGGEGNDTIIGTVAEDEIWGGVGSDNLFGGAGNDTIFGGNGRDVIGGGSGNDYLAGDGGNDTFRDTTAGLSGDRIAYFEVGDKIVIADATLESFTFGLSLDGARLDFTGGAILFDSPVGVALVARAAEGGGVEISIRDADNDFNGDGRSDVLWRNDNGIVMNWLGRGNGGFISNYPTSAIGVPASWSIVGTGDFNGDGRDDVLWRNANGSVMNWLGSYAGGFASNQGNSLIGVPATWTVSGVGDFNGDGRDDVLWRNSNGTVIDWLGQANGGFLSNQANSAIGVPVSWHIAGIGDFNGDGRDDVLWRNDNGSVSDWLGQANGGFVSNQASSAIGVPAIWHIAGVGDFNGDGRDDVLWRNDNGTVIDWLGQANGGFVSNQPNSATGVPLSWAIAGVGDYNGDGRDDVLWRNSNGTVIDWLGQANGGFVGNQANSAIGVPLAWHIQPSDLI